VLGWDGPPTQVLLNSFDGRPAYRFRAGRDQAIVYADTGTRQTGASQDLIRRAALAWAGPQAGSPGEIPVTEPDQWTLQGQLRSLRPLWKYTFRDGQQVYVSGVSGEVVQATTRASRFWAYLGAIPHWMYFTPLRIHQKEWTNFVVWSSGAGTVAGLLGIMVGIWMYSPRKRYRHAGQPSGIPYSGQKRWHTILGLLFGLLACTWAFSGMLSMDPFPRNTGGPAGGRGKEKGRGFGSSGLAQIPTALRGAHFEMSAFLRLHPRDALRSADAAGVKELELTTVAGDPMYVAAAAAADSLFIPLEGAPFRDFGRQRVETALARAASPAQLSIREVTQYDAYYLDRTRQKPLPVLLVTEKASETNRYYVDPRTAKVVGNYSSSRWMSRWLYHGLHSLDFPWLYNYRPAWDILVITLMLGGTALCVTSLILTWQVLQRKIARGPRS
jgi:PepSY-associated TM region